jgi:hypothetical protein
VIRLVVSDLVVQWFTAAVALLVIAGVVLVVTVGRSRTDPGHSAARRAENEDGPDERPSRRSA